MGAISAALASFARSKGVNIETDAPVARVIVEHGKACGVELEDGRVLKARAIAGNVHPQTLLMKMLGDRFLDEEQRRRLQHYRSHSATFRMNVALSELPRFDALPRSDNESLSAAVELCPSLDYMRRAFSDAQQHGWSRECIVSMYIPSTQDDTLAPPGCHVASLFCQHFRRHLPDGRDWDTVKQQVADGIIGQVAAHSSNFRRAIVGMQIKSPLEIERDLGMVGGDIFHGALHPDQLYALRPAAGMAGYRMPVKGLYLCGSGAHPGGGVTGLPGRNAAREILREMRR
jgi:phytoene dehydrogenase-like protein